MSQICGMVGPGLGPEQQALLDRMCEANWAGSAGVRKVSGRGAAMAVWSPPGAAVRGESGQALPEDPVSVFCGRAVWKGTDEPAEADQALTCMGPSQASQIGADPATAASRLNGIFAGAHWDAQASRLTLVTDRYAYRPLYYYHDDSRQLVAFSSRLMGLVRSGAAPIRPNWAACSVFAYFAHCLGDETMFEGVHRMPVGKSLVFDADGMRLEEHWSANDLAIREDMSPDEAIEANGRRFEGAIRRSLRFAGARPVVFLSGGLDSRLIAAEMRRQGADFVTYTTRGFAPAPVDRAAAEEVARRLGVPNTFVDLPDDFISRCWNEAAELTDYETPLHQWALPMTEALSEDLTSGYNGLSGDTLNLMVLSDGPFRDPARFEQAGRMGPRQLAEIFAGPGSTLEFLSGPIRRALSYDAAVTKAESELAKYDESPNRLALFTLLNRTRRAISLAPLQIVQRKVEPLLPFMDDEYFDFAMSIPPKIRIPRCLRTEVLQARYPEVADIPKALRPQQARAASDRNDAFAYRRLVKQLHRRRVGRLLIRNSWMYHRPRAAVRAVHYLLKGENYMFNERLCALLSWLATFFPGGKGM